MNNRSQLIALNTSGQICSEYLANLHQIYQFTNHKSVIDLVEVLLTEVFLRGECLCSFVPHPFSPPFAVGKACLVASLLTSSERGRSLAVCSDAKIYGVIALVNRGHDKPRSIPLMQKERSAAQGLSEFSNQLAFLRQGIHTTKRLK